MGGCATKPRDSDPQILPREKPASPNRIPETVEGKATEKIDTGKTANVLTESKEEPLLDLSEPAPTAPHWEGEVMAETAPAIAELASEIGVPKPESGDSEKAPKIEHIEENKVEVQSVDTDQKEEAAIPTEDSNKVDTDTNVGGDGPSPDSEDLEKKDMEMSLIST